MEEGAREVQEGEVNGYEMRRIRNIEENEKFFEELGLKRRTRNSVQLLNEDKPNNVLSDEDGSEYMCRENDQEQQSDHEEDIVVSKVYFCDFFTKFVLASFNFQNLL